MIRVFFIFAVPIAVLLYAVALEAPLYLDDAPVLQNARLMWTSRTLGFASFWLNEQIIPILAPAFPWKAQFYFRFGNVLIHAFAAAALFWLAIEITGRWRIGAIAGALFLIHPIQTQAVTYISQRFESQATLFMLLCAAAYARFRNHGRRRWFVLSVLCGVASALTKETGYVLPLWILTIEAVFFDWRVIKKRAPYLGILAAVLAVPVLRSIWNAGPTLWSIPWQHYLLSQGPVLSRYLYLVLWPHELYLFYDFAAIEALTIGSALQWMLIAAFGAVGFYYLRRRPVIGFGILSFFILLLPVILLPLPDLIFEHRMYPAMAGLCIAAAAGLNLLKPRLAAILLIVISVPLAYRTVRRNAEWNDPIRFLEMHRERFSTSPLILTNLSAQYANRGEVEKALAASTEARKNEGRANAYYRNHVAEVTSVNLGFQYLQMQDFAAARKEAERAVRINSRDVPPMWLLSAVQVAERDYTAAAGTYKRMLIMEPDNLRAWHALQQTYADLGDTERRSIVERRVESLEKAAKTQTAERFVLPAKYSTAVIYVTILLFLALVVWSAHTVWVQIRPSTTLVGTLLRRPPRA